MHRTGECIGVPRNTDTVSPSRSTATLPCFNELTLHSDRHRCVFVFVQFLPLTLMGPAAMGAAPDGSPQLSLDRMFQGFSDSASEAVRSRMFPQATMPPVTLGGSRDLQTDVKDIVHAADTLQDML